MLHNPYINGRRLSALLSLLSFFGLYGCAVAVVGIGAAAGVGTFSYFSGKLTKTYESEYHETVQASSDTLERLKIPITDIIADELKTEIKAERPDETPVNIEVVRIDREHTEVSVRTGSVGIWDRRVSEQIQGFIDENLTQKTIDEKKSSEDLAKEDTQPTIGEVVRPEITEEDLADESVPESLQTATITGPDSQAREKTPPKAAEMHTGSAVVIFFEQNSNELTDKALQKLDRVYEILVENFEVPITINGYSDSIGAASYNEMISEIRANAVKSYLIGRGIAPSRMTALGHGAQNFIASNKTSEGRRMNRRVEIEIISTKTE